MASSKSTFEYGEVARICREMGYEPENVISIRITATDMWFTYVDRSAPKSPETGLCPLRTQTHEITR